MPRATLFSLDHPIATVMTNVLSLPLSACTTSVWKIRWSHVSVALFLDFLYTRIRYSLLQIQLQNVFLPLFLWNRTPAYPRPLTVSLSTENPVHASSRICCPVEPYKCKPWSASCRHFLIRFQEHTNFCPEGATQKLYRRGGFTPGYHTLVYILKRPHHRKNKQKIVLNTVRRPRKFSNQPIDTEVNTELNLVMVLSLGFGSGIEVRRRTAMSSRYT